MLNELKIGVVLQDTNKRAANSPKHAIGNKSYEVYPSVDEQNWAVYVCVCVCGGYTVYSELKPI